MSADIEEQYDKIYRYCYFKTQNAALAEDLTQECFLKYISQNTYVERGKELAYLYTIARNLCMDTFRRKAFVPLDENAGTEEVLLHRAAKAVCAPGTLFTLIPGARAAASALCRTAFRETDFSYYRPVPLCGLPKVRTGSG